MTDSKYYAANINQLTKIKEFMSENKKIAVMLIVVIMLCVSMVALIHKKPIISSDNKFLQKCITKELNCTIFLNKNYGFHYRVEIDSFNKTINTGKEALEFIKKVENFNSITN